ncbi:hypothetical protein [Streptomyces sp. TRM68416]|uniref:hypothetical protein n=1 Tax=Streptomyces sp. TRM68416 TaxID=2758412 RepID=UPI0016619EE9|nr:hypothetical protein [Streptomyces sp. TRM68416]MBD0838817.1 hypothetical protein [Streptomyces sp. TRM68416]
MTTQHTEAAVRLVLDLDLTGRYDSHRQVAEALREQTRRSLDCDTVIVHLGADAVRHNIDLGRSIAAAFFLTARRIEVHAPAGNVLGPIIHAEVARYVRLFTADHARQAAEQPAGHPPG